MPNQIDIAELKRQHESNRLFKDIIYCLSCIDNAKTESTVEIDELLENLKTEGISINRNLLITAMRTLENTGVGRLIVGRKGKKSRFESVVPFVQLADLATDSKVETEIAEVPTSGVSANVNRPINSSKSNEAAKWSSDKIKAKSEKKDVQIRFQITPEFVVTATVPETLSKKEALKLADFIKSLPFEPGDDVEE